MTRFYFGGTSVDWLYDPIRFGERRVLALASNATTLTFWDAAAGGTQHLDLLDPAGLPMSLLLVEGHQIPRFRGPDGIDGMWADKNDGTPREFMEARNLGPSLDLASKLSKYNRIDVTADHDADRTGSSSAVVAFDNAIEQANDAGGNVEIVVPPGLFDLTAGLSNVIEQPNVYVRGAARGATTLRGQHGTMFTWGAGLDGGGLSDVTLAYPSPDTDSRAISADDAHRLRFERLTLNKVRQLARLGDSAHCGQALFRDIYGYTDPTAGSVVLDAISGAGLTLDNVVAFPLGISFPSGTDPHPGTDLTFLRFGQDSWDTVHARGVVSNRFGRGLDIVASGAVAVINLWFTDCVFDYNKYNAIRILATAGANVDHLFFNSGYFVASDGIGVEIGGDGATIRHVHFTDVLCSQSGKNNWRLSGNSMDDVTLTNCLGMGANRLPGNTGNDQDDLVILGSGVNVQGGRYGESGAIYGLFGQGRYGVYAAPDLAAVRVTDAEAGGGTSSFSLGSNTGGSARRLVHNNRTLASAAPAYATSSTVVAPSSGVTQTHLASTVDSLYIYGGTVSNISHNGTTIATSGPVTLTLRPGDTWSVTYSSSPTIKRVVSP